MNALAQELNDTLKGTIVSDLLSEMGRRFYFPKGIVSQTAEAKKLARRYNATVGMAFEKGEPLHLSAIRNYLPELSPKEIFAYSTTSGEQALRETWRKEMVRKNPDLEGKPTSTPLVVSGITHGLSTVADLLADAGDVIVLPDMFWGNYRLIFTERHGVRVASFPFFDDKGGFNLAGLRDVLHQESRNDSPNGSQNDSQNHKIIVLLNFPNNPTGYSPTEQEKNDIVQILTETADSGAKIAAVTDDAYFGLFYEQETYKQSLFAPLATAHPNILAVKADGATKEELVWGFRIGFLTFAAPGLSPEHYDALEKKNMGIIRSYTSNPSRVGQSLLLKGLHSGSHDEEKGQILRILETKYGKVKQILSGASTPASLSPLPFNSGYFMCFKTNGIDAEKLRKQLLHEEGIGTIAINARHLRIAYSYADLDDLQGLYRTIFKQAEKLA